MAEVASSARNVLSPIPPSHLNRRGATSKKKRKLAEYVVEDSQMQSFTATLLPGANTKSVHTLVPILQLDRLQLRLSYLDLSPAQTLFTSGHPFSADIPLFNDASTNDSKLLLARLAPNGGLYIIERVGDGLYVACQLRSTVTKDFFTTSAGVYADKYPLEKLCGYEIPTFAHARRIPESKLAGVSKTSLPSPKRPKNRRGVLARNSILPRKEHVEQPAIPNEQEHEPVEEAPSKSREPADALKSTLSKGDLNASTQGVQDQSTPKNAAEMAPAGLDPSCSLDELFETLREILPRTLYTSQTALAYFTKSTLARARAAFRSSNTLSTSELVSFYRTRLLSSKKMDSKYRETIPKIIDTTIQEGSPDKRKPLSNGSKKKHSRKKQLGKDGLFPGEEAFIRSWWWSRDSKRDEMLGLQSREHEVQYLLKELRNRETQLQIILILEILSLESTGEAEREGTVFASALKQEPDDEESKSVLAKTPSKAKKQRDLKPDLDILVDRLCIYQTVSTFDVSTSDEAQLKNNESGKRVSDKLRDFACNVILPFYLHKAPHLVKEISRKLGGPDISAKGSSGPSRTSSHTKPGAAIDPSRRTIRRQTLERVLSEEQGSRHPSPPTLMRSATAPLDINSSRDAADITQRPCSRGRFQKSRSFTNREVDLVANSKVQEAKRKKLANLVTQKEELDAAIQALKKPNRSLVGLEIMTEVEKRSAERVAARRSALSANSSIQTLDVQITATPKKGESVHHVLGKRSLGRNVMIEPFDQASAAIEEATVPSSTVKDPNHNSNHLHHRPSDTCTTRQSAHAAIHETPSRRASKTSYPLALPPDRHTLFAQPDSPPVRSSLLPPPDHNLSLIHATPSINRLQPPDHNLSQVETTPLRMTKSQRPVLFTPLRKAEVDVETAFRDAPLVAGRWGKVANRGVDGGSGDGRSGDGGLGGGKGKEVSIYESLGWDEEVDELL